MAARFFGQYLLERGVVTAEGLFKAVEYQSALNLRLGELAVRGGLLTRDEAEQINRAQRRQDANFGDVAIARQKLTHEQVRRLVAEQKASHVPIGEALVVAGALDRASLLRELALFGHEQDRDRIGIDSSRSAIRWATGPVYVTLVQSTVKLLRRVAGRVSKEGAPRELRGALPPADLQIRAPISGEWKGDYVLRLTDELAREIAVQIAERPAPTAAQKVEAACDFVASVCAQACAALVASGVSCQAEPPEGLAPAMGVELPGRAIALFPLATAQGTVEVAIVISA